ncbi:unnamed protein product [Schistosoma turkestanicum]|nr:unnamed protein product [Schistosoma turkestanicum]
MSDRESRLEAIESAIGIVPHFPVEGIFFRDFFCVFRNPVLTQYLLDELYFLATSAIQREYKDTVEIRRDALNAGDNVILLDDVLATGGSLEACYNLIKLSGAKVLSTLVFLEATDLNAREKFKKLNVDTHSVFQI